MYVATVGRGCQGEGLVSNLSHAALRHPVLQGLQIKHALEQHVAPTVNKMTTRFLAQNGSEVSL